MTQAVVRTSRAWLVVLGLALAALLPAGPATAQLGGPLPAAWAMGAPTTLTLAADRPSVRYGGSVPLSGRLTDTATGSSVAGAAVQLESLDPAGVWLTVTTLTTDPGGLVSGVVTPLAATSFRLRYADPGTAAVSTSSAVTVTVRAALTAEVSRPAVRAGHAVRLTGTLLPVDGPVRVERRVPGRWQQVESVQPAPDGSFATTLRPTAPGWSRWRVVRPDTAARAGAALRLPRVNAYRLHTYSVTTRGRISADPAVFRASVAATYADPRGWLRAHHGFREVARGGDLTVVLAQAAALPGFSRVCSTSYSCRVGRYVVINQDRWRRGSPYFPADLLTYRRMVLDHETGHWLGLGHAYCRRPGAAAAVMQQQSKGMRGCRPNPWPLAREIRALS